MEFAYYVYDARLDPMHVIGGGINEAATFGEVLQGAVAEFQRHRPAATIYVERVTVEQYRKDSGE